MKTKITIGLLFAIALSISGQKVIMTRNDSLMSKKNIEINKSILIYKPQYIT